MSNGNGAPQPQPGAATAPGAPGRDRDKMFDPIGTVQAPMDRRFYGKYRGTVVTNIDPDITAPPGRVLVWVDHIPGAFPNWAMPCVPYAGLNVGFWAIPPTGASVWVEFEGGDPARPVWSGCFWQVTDFLLPRTKNPIAPAMAKIFKTDTTTLVINDTPGVGGLSLDVSPPAVTVPVSLEINSLGVKLTCATCTITITPSVSIELAVGATKVQLTPASQSVTTTSASIKAANTSVQSVTDITGNVTIKGNTTNQGPFAVQGASSLTGNVSVTGATSMTGDVSVTGNSSFTGNASVTGNTSLTGATTLSGATTAAGGVTVGGAVTVGGTVTAPAMVGVLNGTVIPPPV
ncbi:MAG TPA: phage baseplate assembly protein V [Thermoanaerobaculia bacterium]|nr:phage baseplate assembly protein V [Thermoanaerobaculia bacterium]